MAASSRNPALVGWALRKRLGSTRYRFSTPLAATAVAQVAGRGRAGGAARTEPGPTESARTKARKAGTLRLFMSKWRTIARAGNSGAGRELFPDHQARRRGWASVLKMTRSKSRVVSGAKRR